jgi:hypothetical protein
MPAGGKPYGKPMKGMKKRPGKPEDRSVNDPGMFKGKAKFSSKSRFGGGGRVRSAKS